MLLLFPKTGAKQFWSFLFHATASCCSFWYVFKSLKSSSFYFIFTQRILYSHSCWSCFWIIIHLLHFYFGLLREWLTEGIAIFPAWYLISGRHWGSWKLMLLQYLLIAADSLFEIWELVLDGKMWSPLQRLKGSAYNCSWCPHLLGLSNSLSYYQEFYNVQWWDNGARGRGENTGPRLLRCLFHDRSRPISRHSHVIISWRFYVVRLVLLSYVCW